MPELDKIIVGFIADILSYSKNKQDHAENMHIVLQQFRNSQLYAKFFQGKILPRQSEIFGLPIYNEGIAIDPSKIPNMMDWTSSTSIHQTRNLLNLIDYYRCCNLDFSRIANPMTELLK